MSTIELNSGASVPVIGFGAGTAWFARGGVDEELRDAVLTALRGGYTHLDLAEMYGNEESVAAALKQWDGDRNSLFVTEKILGGMADIRGTLQKQLKTLGLDYVDLYLLHASEPLFPKGSPSLQEAWAQMELLQKEGLTRTIGVSNHRVRDIEKILENCKVVPALNQIELHPYVYRETKEIVDFCHLKGIKIEAYSPCASITTFSGGPVDAVIIDVAQSLSGRTQQPVTPGQVLLKWAVQKGDIAITTSGKESRMKEQSAAFTLPPLTDAELAVVENAGAKAPVQRKSKGMYPY